MTLQETTVCIGDKLVGEGRPVFVIAEIGINHNGEVDLAKELIDGAIFAGADAVKFQKRTPEKCVPLDQWYAERDTPWGRLTYIDYRRKIELNQQEYTQIDEYCKKRGIPWFASCWDEDSVDFMRQFNPPCYKTASASLTDIELLSKCRSTGKPLIISTGMSMLQEIERAVEAIGFQNLLIAHSTSNYPCPPEELNIRMIQTLRKMYPSCPIGYSGHEVGLSPTWAAVTLGATFVERHITLDRSMWGSDQAASVEISGFRRLIGNIRDIEKSLGDGVKRVYVGELGKRKTLRRAASSPVDCVI